MTAPTVSLRNLLPLVLLLLGAALVLGGCASGRDGAQQRLSRFGPDSLYEQGKRAIRASDWGEAVNVFEALKARWPFTPHARQGTLDLIYAYYKLGEKESGRDTADTFIRENPKDPNIDYAYYVRGLIDYERTPGLSHRLFRIDLAERVPQSARDSFESFRIVVTEYPKSRYAHDARRRMVYLRNRLADYELRVADHYLQRGAWVAAAQRAHQTIEQYDGAPAVKDALRIMIHSYRKLNYDDLAANTVKVFEANFPGESTELTSKEKRWWKVW